MDIFFVRSLTSFYSENQSSFLIQLFICTNEVDVYSYGEWAYGKIECGVTHFYRVEIWIWAKIYSVRAENWIMHNVAYDMYVEHNKSWSFVRFLEKMSTQSQCWNCPIVWHKRWLLYQNCVKHICHCSVVVKRSVWFWHIFACSQLGSQSQFYFYLYAFSHTFLCFIFCENVWLHFHHQLSLLLFSCESIFFFLRTKNWFVAHFCHIEFVVCTLHSVCTSWYVLGVYSKLYRLAKICIHIGTLGVHDEN